LGPPARPDRVALTEPMARLALRGPLELPVLRVRSVLLDSLARQALQGLQVLQERLG
jgi:hypothetical protein